MAEPARRPGRRPGGPDTRGEILSAARHEFAEKSFAGTSVRAIARRAGVDPALVHHYFGTKQKLFAQTLSLGLDPDLLINRLVSVPAEERGPALVRAFLEIWDDAAGRAPFLALLRSAMTEPAATRTVRQLAEEIMLPLARPMVSGPDAELRLQLAVSHLIGTAVMRHVVGAEPLASASVEELVRHVGPVVQDYLDGA